MSATKIRNLPELHFGKRSLTQPLGPSVSGGALLTVKPTHLPKPPLETKIKTLISDDSYDSSSSPEEKTVSPKVWTKNPLQLERTLSTPNQDVVSSSTGNLFTGSAWERTKKIGLPAEDENVPKRSLRKSKRHRSLDAKTARFYAKRKQTSWTGLGIRGRASSSSDEENGGKKIRERSPRRKKGSKDNSSVSSKTPSRDPSVASRPLPKALPKADLAPSTTGVPPKISSEVLPLPAAAPASSAMILPAIQITEPKDFSQKGKIGKVSKRDEFVQEFTGSDQLAELLRQAPKKEEFPTDAQSIEDWILSRKPTASTSMKSSVSTQSLSSLAKKTQVFERPVFPATSSASVTALPWNQPTSRHSLPAGVDESLLGYPKTEPMSPEGVKNMRQFFERLHNDSPTDATVVSDILRKPVSPVQGKSVERPASAMGFHRGPYVPIEPHKAPGYGKIGLAMTSSKSIDFLPLTQGKITADSSFLHNALRISANASKVLDGSSFRGPEETEKITPSASLIQVSDGRSRVRWNSDWQINQPESTKTTQPGRPLSISALDSNKLSVPHSRLPPLKELNHHELEKALEELDEFYESLSTKSEDATLKTNSNDRLDTVGQSMDSGLSSLQPQYLSKENIGSTENEPNRLEYTKQWLHSEAHVSAPKNTQTEPLRTTAMIPPPVPVWIPPTETFPVARTRHGSNSFKQSKDAGLRGTQTDRRKDDFAHRPELEFQKYPGTNKAQPHIEMDDLLQRKIIQSQNTPMYKVSADLSKQFPSSRSDYATPNVPVANLRRTREHDLVRDDAAYRQLRHDRKTLAEKFPPNMAEKVGVAPGHSRTRSVSSAIKQLAKQFETAATEPKKETKPSFFRKIIAKSQSTPVTEAVQAAVQIDGRRMALRLPLKSDSDRTQEKWSSTGQGSPQISPMNDQQMDDLLLSLSSFTSAMGSGSRNGFHATSAKNPWDRMGKAKGVVPSKAGVAV